MMKLKNFPQSKLIRFMISGSISTLFMWGIYIVFKEFYSYQLAYLLSYIFAIVFTYFLNTIYVFHKKISLKTFLSFPLIYVAQYGIGALLLEIFAHFGFSLTYAPILIIILLLPLTFSLNKIVLRTAKK